MRVLWLTSVVPVAVTTHLRTAHTEGPASWVEALRQALSGHEGVDLAIASPSPVPFEPFAADGVAYYGMPVLAARTRLGRAASAWHSSFNLPDMNDACLEVLRRFGPDLVHIHGTENPWGLVGRDSPTPVLISLQGLLTVIERYYFQGMTWREVTNLALSRDFALGRSEIHGYWRCAREAAREREIMRINDSFVGRTEWDRAVLWAVNPNAKYYHCDEILRPHFYEATWRHDARSPPTVFCTSNTASRKGAGCLIEALALLRRAGYEDVRVRIAGIPSEGPGNEFYATRARQHGVSASIDWLGNLDAEQLAAELVGAAVFVHPSHVDNSPNALCEALLVGVPTVASYVGGVPSLLVDEREGLLFPDRDPYALAGRIRHLLDNPGLAAEMGRNARERALRRHDSASIVKRLFELYNHILRGGEEAHD